MANAKVQILALLASTITSAIAMMRATPAAILTPTPEPAQPAQTQHINSSTINALSHHFAPPITISKAVSASTTNVEFIIPPMAHVSHAYPLLIILAMVVVYL